MKPKLQLTRLSLAFALAVAALATPALAGKPSKPDGGGDSQASGVIQFFAGGGPFWTMNADGSNKQVVSPPWGLPSHQLHGGARWLLTTWPNPVTGNEELALVREDGDPGSMLYTGIPARSALRARWAKDDAFISYAGGPTPFVPGSENAIYRAELDWDEAGLPSLATGFFPVITGTFNEAGNIELGVYFDWFPDGLSVVYIRLTAGFGVIEPLMRVTDLVTGNSSLLANTYSYMEWSPDGSRIAVAIRENESSSQNIHTVSPAGGGWVRVTNAGKSKNDFWPVWSPDSKYIAFGRQQTNTKGGFTTTTGDVYRVPAGGGSAVNLTGEMSDKGTKRPNAWR